MKKLDFFELREFCDIGGSGKIGEPFSDSTFTYATDGAIIVRIPRVELVTKKNPIPKSLFNDLLFSPKHEGKWSEMPAYSQPSKVLCPDCEGSKYVEDCYECEADAGKIIFENMWNSYDVECKSCIGVGYLQSRKKNKNSRLCPHCKGGGGIYKKRNPSIIMQNIRLNIYLLDKIKDLPGIKLFFPPLKNIISYKFDGGDGLLMEMRN